jgi:hypothetical protein
VTPEQTLRDLMAAVERGDMDTFLRIDQSLAPGEREAVRDAGFELVTGHLVREIEEQQ